MGDQSNGSHSLGDRDDTPTISPHARLRRAIGNAGISLQAGAGLLRQISLSADSVDLHKLAVAISDLRDSLDQTLLLVETAVNVLLRNP